MLAIEGVGTRTSTDSFPCRTSRSGIEIDLVSQDPRSYRELASRTAPDDREELVQRYTCGQCGVLATCLHQLLGWEVCGIFAHNKGILLKGIPELQIPPRHVPAHWCVRTPVHVVVRNPRTRLYTNATGAELSWAEITRPYRTKPHPMRVRIRPMLEVDYFVRSSADYEVCLLDHIPRLFPGLV